jgi:hypothetical protein
VGYEPLLKFFRLLASRLDCFEVLQPIVFEELAEAAGLVECYFSGLLFKGHPIQEKNYSGLLAHGVL